MSEKTLAKRTGRAHLHAVRVGTRIMLRRTDLRLSQRGLAAIIGYDQRAIGQWENGEAYPRIEAQFALADALGLDPDQLFTFNRQVVTWPREE